MTNKYYDTTDLTMLQINYMVNKLAYDAGVEPKTTMFFAHEVRSCPFIYISDGIVTFTGCPDGEIMDLPCSIEYMTKEKVSEWVDAKGWDIEKAFGKTSSVLSHLLDDECWLWHDYQDFICKDPAYAAIAFYIDIQYLPWDESRRVV